MRSTLTKRMVSAFTTTQSGRALPDTPSNNLTNPFSLAFRGEVFNDGGGTRTGVPQTLQGYTLTPEYDMAAKFSDINTRLKKLDGKFVIRGEVRLDRSNKNVFQRQNTFIGAAVHIGHQPDLLVLICSLARGLDRKS